MASDDYFVIVYQLLDYLYNCLKKGEKPDLFGLDNFREAKGINKHYWDYILFQMCEQGFVSGVVPAPVLNQKWPSIKIVPDFGILPRGIEYLQDNSKMKQMKDFAIKGALQTIPAFLSLMLHV